MKRIIYLISVILAGLFSCKNQQTINGLEAHEVEEQEYFVTEEYLALEDSHKEMLEPISSLKSSDPKIYWFIVSWLNTNYKTPNWEGYGTEVWREKTKARGIDCSGFARVMQDEIFDKVIRGGSQGILYNYCNRKSATKLKMGDLLFFKAPYSKSNRIVHIGVYLKNRNFVHATSHKSAVEGLGLMINSLDEKNWSEEFVTAGEVK